MTVLFTILTPAPGTDRETFHDHWRHPHGTLGSRLAALRGYVQNHRIRPAGVQLPEDQAEGVVRVELQDGTTPSSIAEDPLYADHLALDERRFIDLEAIRPYVTEAVFRRRANSVDTESSRPDPEQTTGNLADQYWSPDEAGSAITLIRFLTDEPEDHAHRASEVGALWHAGYRVTAGAEEGDATRFIEQFWWPTLTRCLEHSSRPVWNELITAEQVDRVMLATCERLR